MHLRPISRQLFICLQSVSDGAASNLFLQFFTACKIRLVSSTLCKAKMYNKHKKIYHHLDCLNMISYKFDKVLAQGYIIKRADPVPCYDLYDYYTQTVNVCLP